MADSRITDELVDDWQSLVSRLPRRKLERTSAGSEKKLRGSKEYFKLRFHLSFVSIFIQIEIFLKISYKSFSEFFWKNGNNLN